MGQVEDLLFETERRSILFHRGTSMPDGSQLAYDGDPNNAAPDNSDGEFLLHYSPSGTRYLQKASIPYTIWEKLEDGAGGIWAKSKAEFDTNVYLQTNSDIGGNRAVSSIGGYAGYADYDTLNIAIGISTAAVSSGTDVAIQTSGKMSITGAGFIQDEPVFVGSNGTLTQTPGGSGFIQKVGIAISNEALLIEIAQPIFA